jgi:segregation and condensation protein A
LEVESWPFSGTRQESLYLLQKGVPALFGAAPDVAGTPLCSEDFDMNTTEAVEASPYQVKLAIFEGPLDLLLHLIKREELDITKVSLAQVTDQYLEHLSFLEELNAEILADFLVVAAKLLLIKSEILLPRPPGAPGEEEEEDVGDELARQLIEYKKFKEAALGLREREKMGFRAYVRVAPLPKLERPLDLGDVSLADLAEAVRLALDVRPPAPSVSEVVTPFTITVAEKMALIKEKLERQQPVECTGISFNHLLAQAASRLEIIVTFLAVLELIKLNGIEVQQERLFGEIFISEKPPNQGQGQERAQSIEADVG